MRNILVIGGSGFVGSAIVRRLAAQGDRVTVVTRRRERARALVLLPNVEVREGNVHDDATLQRLVAGRDAVISLVGILHGDRGVPYGRAFAVAHVELPRRVAAACAAAGVPRLLHMSALGASPTGPSMYQRSKGDGEAAVRDHAGATAWTLFRPSVVFGRDDSFLNLFADMQAFAPFVPVGGADAKLQPIHVEDVAQAFAVALDLKAAQGRVYDLVGPRVYTLRELIEFAGRAGGHPRPVIALPDALARLQAWSMEYLPGAPLSRDNLDSLKIDNVSPEGIAPELGIAPAQMEPLALQWLGTEGVRQRLMRLRQRAGR